MFSKSSLAVVLGGAVAVLAACHDAPSPVAPQLQRASASLSTLPGDQGRHVGAVPFVCTSIRRVETPAVTWPMQRDTLFFPRGELDQGGRTVRYVLRQHTTDGALHYAAFCDVPYTEQALRRVDRYFGVQKAGGAEQFVARGEIKTPSCVIGGVCVLEPLHVEAPPKENEEKELCPVDAFGNDLCSPNTEGGGGGGPGGDGPVSSCETQGYTESGSCDGDVIPEEEEAKSCPSLLVGKIVTALIPVAGRNHEFRFEGSVLAPLVRTSGPRSPATYVVNPTLSEDGWWMAESGTIKVNCSGGYSPSAFGYRLFIGTASYAGQNDLHMVLGPGHPSF